MNISKTFLSLLICVITITSCSDSKDNKLIIGNWQGTEWLANGQPSNNDAANTFFSFDNKGGYNYEYAGHKETGKYKIENDMLFTTPKGENEIMVKIAKLTSDSLVFDMNRGGGQEMLTLIKK